MIKSKFNSDYYEYLAKRIRKHDKNAFTELYNATYDDLYRYAFYFLKDSHMAQDALQEIYISVYKNISTLKSDRLLYSWIRQITYHVCCDFTRKKNSISTYETYGVSDDVSFLQIADSGDSLQDIWDQDLSEHLDEWLKELSPHVRQAFILRYQNGLKLEEIADFMNCSLSSVKRYLNTSRDFLRTRLDKYRS